MKEGKKKKKKRMEVRCLGKKEGKKAFVGLLDGA